jgi:hypothetical protein
MAISFTCECGKKYKAKDEFAGRTAFCSECRREFVIPNQGVSAPARPPEEPIFRGRRLDGDPDQEEVNEAGYPILERWGNAWAEVAAFVRRAWIPRPLVKSRSAKPIFDPYDGLGPTDIGRPNPRPIQTTSPHPPSPTQQNTTIVYVYPQSSNGLAVAGFTFALLGFLTCGCLSPIGLALSFMSLDHKPRGLAVAGCILGGIGSIWVFVILGLFFAGVFIRLWG